MGGVGSGGANGGPQYSPMNVNALGGNGQSGTQAAKYIPGLSYGQGQATMQQQQAAPMKGNIQDRAIRGYGVNMPEPLPLTAPTTRPNEPVTAGAAVGAGPGNEALNLPMGQQAQDPDINMIRMYYPILEFWANQPGTSQATKDYVQFLRGVI